LTENLYALETTAFGAYCNATVVDKPKSVSSLPVVDASINFSNAECPRYIVLSSVVNVTVVMYSEGVPTYDSGMTLEAGLKGEAPTTYSTPIKVADGIHVFTVNLGNEGKYEAKAIPSAAYSNVPTSTCSFRSLFKPQVSTPDVSLLTIFLLAVTAFAYLGWSKKKR
ncbi:hypothetical protein HY993_01430, partial [Candidatus Micrarchaeota archaeon]|nr:hypothetical protein [Candidatus Micrarchaeota archaeon]